MFKSRLDTVGVVTVTLVFFGLGAAGPAPSASGNPYALGRLEVTAGALPSRESGVLFSQTLDYSCRAWPTESTDSTLAGRVGLSITLGLGIHGCRVSQEPSVSCAWRVEPAPSSDPSCRVPDIATEGTATGDTGSFEGWDGEIEIQLPERTGIYELVLECGAGAAFVPVRRPVFVTYAEPLTWVSPPAVDWYSRAACWGGDFAATASEDEVVRAIHDGIFSYGTRHWAYGYAYDEKDGRARFPVTSTPNAKVDILYHVSDPDALDCSDGTCRCRWWALAWLDDSCNFSDCFVFSRILQGISATTGIGGMVDDTIEGAFKKGFVTTPGSKSIDPDFPGNVRCQLRHECFPYNFWLHSLRDRDGDFYDMTFGEIYENRDAGIGLSVSERLGSVQIYSKAPLRTRYTNRGYGTWPFFNAMLEPPNVELSLRKPPKSFSFSSHASFSPVLGAAGSHDPNPDLAVAFEISTLAEGEYFFFGSLYKGDRMITDNPLGETIMPSFSTVAGQPGEYLLTLKFSGQQIHDSGLDGPYEVRVDGGGPVGQESSVYTESTVYETPDYQHSDFGELTVMNGVIDLPFFNSVPSGKDAEAPISVPVKIDEAGRYVWEVRMAKGHETLGYYGKWVNLKKGPGVIAIKIPSTVYTEADSMTFVLFNDLLKNAFSWKCSMEDLLDKVCPTPPSE